MCALVVPLAGVSFGARAEQVEWVIKGSVSQLTQYSLNGMGDIVGTKDVTQIATMHVGQQFTLDIIKDSTSYMGDVVTFKTSDNTLSYKNLTPANGPVQVTFDANTTMGWMWARLTNVDGASKPTWLSSMNVQFTIPTWAGSTQTHSLQELSQALAAGNYDPNVVMSAKLTNMPDGTYPLGNAQFTVSSVSVQAVPEASTLATFSLGLLSLAGVVRTQRARRRHVVMA